MIFSIVLLFSKIKLGGIEIIDFDKLIELVIRFGFNLSVIIILVRWLYYKNTQRKDYLFTYILIGSIIFLLCFMLENVKLELGFALGLFAIFGIIRYRTDQMPIREMTYLFVVIGISVINALSNKKISVVEVLFTNAFIVFIAYGFERVWLLKHETAKLINYEKIELVKPEKYEELLADLQERTGIQKINRVEVGKIDFLRDTCRLTIYYYETGRVINQTNLADLNRSNGDDD